MYHSAKAWNYNKKCVKQQATDLYKSYISRICEVKYWNKCWNKNWTLNALSAQFWTKECNKVIHWINPCGNWAMYGSKWSRMAIRFVLEHEVEYES